MAVANTSIKRVAITKANAQTLGMIAGAAFISVFCLVASKTLWSQNLYLNKIVDRKEAANVQLDANIKAGNSLAAAYEEFSTKEPNLLGGTIAGTTDKDGDNARLILDALPSSYDFPALTSTIEKILTDRNFKVSGITGNDDEVAQQVAAVASATPAPVPIAFSFGVSSASYESVQELMLSLQRSIRPIQIDTLNMTGDAESMNVSVTAHTYYQPPKKVNISTKALE